MFTLAYHRKHKVLLAHFSGVFSSEDIEEVDRAVIAFTAREGPSHGLLDFTEVEAVSVPLSRLVLRSQQPAISPGHQRVFVVGANLQALELARTFASQQALAGSSSVRIANTLEEAYALLRLGKEPRFKPVGKN
jgi:hypothetical protein